MTITPYAGTCIHPATVQTDVLADCHPYHHDHDDDDDENDDAKPSSTTITIRPGDLLVGDDDGVLVGSASWFSQILPLAQDIRDAESSIRRQLLQDATPLESLTNVREHWERRQKGLESQLQFQP